MLTILCHFEIVLTDKLRRFRPIVLPLASEVVLTT